MAEDAKAAPAAGEAKQGGTERATNCASCNKRLFRKKQYYRNGAYFCNKRCFKAASAKAAKAAAKAETGTKTPATSDDATAPAANG